jgi:hypothetical protein
MILEFLLGFMVWCGIVVCGLVVGFGVVVWVCDLEYGIEFRGQNN